MMGTTEVYETDLPNLELVDLSSVEFFRYYGAPEGQEFHHYRVSGGGHDWFGAWGNQDIESTDLLWDFSNRTVPGSLLQSKRHSRRKPNWWSGRATVCACWMAAMCGFLTCRADWCRIGPMRLPGWCCPALS